MSDECLQPAGAVGGAGSAQAQCQRETASGGTGLREGSGQRGKCTAGLWGTGNSSSRTAPSGNRISTARDAKDVPGRAQEEGPALGHRDRDRAGMCRMAKKVSDDFWGDGADLTPQK